MPGRRSRDALARAAGERPADRRVQPVPAAARRVPAARPDVRLRGGGPPRRPDPRRARLVPRRVDDRRARRDRLLDRRRHPLPARPAAPPRGVEARRRPLPRRLRRRRTATSSCSCRPGSCATARRPSCTASADRSRCPSRGPDAKARDCRIRPVVPLDAVALLRLYGAATPQPVQRLEALRLADWERQGANWRVPRSSLAPILRFADVEAFVQEAAGGGKDGTQLDAFVQIGVAKEDQPHYLQDLRPARRRQSPISRTSAWARSRPGRGRWLRPPIGPGRDRPGPDLRVADRSPTRGSGVR